MNTKRYWIKFGIYSCLIGLFLGMGLLGGSSSCLNTTFKEVFVAPFWCQVVYPGFYFEPWQLGISFFLGSWFFYGVVASWIYGKIKNRKTL